jgi:hypothetical protein
MMQLFFFCGQILFDALALSACILLYRKSRMRIFGVLSLWFASRFLTVSLSMIWSRGFDMNPIPIQNITTVVENTLFVYFCQLLISRNWKIWKLIYAWSFIIFGIECYLSNFADVVYNLTSLSYYVTVCGLLTWIMYKEKIPQDILKYIYILFFFHMSVMIYIANLAVIMSDYELFVFTYPLVYVVYLTFDMLSIWYFRSYLKKELKFE